MKKDNWFSLLANLLLAGALLLVFGMLISAVMANDISSSIFMIILLLVGAIFLTM